MAVDAKYTEQFSFVGPTIMQDMIEAVADQAHTRKAPVVRKALDALFGTVDCELAPGDTQEAAVERVVKAMLGR